MSYPLLTLLFSAGLFAGFVDAIAGGGGLITVPALMVALGPGPNVIGTNKIVGAAAAAMALAVYWRKGHFDWKKSLVFAGWVTIGSFAGSRVSPLVPPSWFPWFLALTAPLILYIVWHRDLWAAHVERPRATPAEFHVKVALTGLACGFYDGVWGPGGGTFMFLGLRFAVGMPLLASVAAGRFVNTCSAGIALGSYAEAGYVRWATGLPMAVGITIGAWLGATHATKRSAAIVRPVLALVVALMVLRLLLP